MLAKLTNEDHQMALYIASFLHALAFLHSIQSVAELVEEAREATQTILALGVLAVLQPREQLHRQEGNISLRNLCSTDLVST